MRARLRTLILAAASAAAVAAQAAPVTLVLGNDLFMPGHRYRSGGDWLALACEGAACRLGAARLVVKHSTMDAADGGPSTPGQQLHFARPAAAAGEVLAWLRRDRAVRWLAPGPVPTYASATQGVRRPVDGGSYEVEVPLPGGASATLVPLLDRANERVEIQLRLGDRRQRLGAIDSCAGDGLEDFFRWAGDLDGDGRPDFLVDHGAAAVGGKAVLHLSSRSAAGAPLVGDGAVYEEPPETTECDAGDDWIAP